MTLFKNTARKRNRALSQKQHRKKWPTHNRTFTDPLLLDVIRARQQKEPEDILQEFFVNFDGLTPSWDTYVVRKFFRAYKTDVTANGQPQARAKLDARDFASEAKREYPDWLTPSDLCRALSSKVRPLSLWYTYALIDQDV